MSNPATNPADHVHDGETGSDPVEVLLTQCFLRPEPERAAAVDAACASHPYVAAEVRRRVAALRAIGIDPDARPRFPQQLGDFRLIERLGGGGMGVVYRAEQISLQREVALKLIRPEQLFFSGAQARFRREVEAVARLQHPGIVPIYTVGEHEGIPYFAMELMRGCTLAAALRELKDRAPESLAGRDLHATVCAAAGTSAELIPGSTFDGSWIDVCLRIARQAAEALDYVHRAGLIHRDVKPSNIALTPDGRALLLDFGLTRAPGGGEITASGAQLGTLHYMSPEQLTGSRAIDARSDVYSLGVTLYEMLALQLPYRGTSSREVERLVHDGRVDPLRPRNRRVPSDLETAVLCAIDRDFARRYASAGAFARDLGHLLVHQPIEARRPGALLRARRWTQRHPAAATAALLGPALVLGAGALLLAREKSHSRTLSQTNVELAAETRRAEDEARRARLERALAEQRAVEVLSLSAGKDLDDLIAQADQLWPARPENAPRFEAWLAAARALVGGTPADPERGLRARPGLADHRRKLIEFEQAGSAEDERDRSWWRAQLAGLVARLEAFADPRTGLLASGTDPVHGCGIAKRLEWARTIEERSVSSPDARARWDEARASIADRAHCPLYGGLTLAPQLGLLPIGRDPASALWEFAHLETGEPAERDGDGRLHPTEATGLVFVLLPGGSFHIGAQSIDPAAPNWDPRATPDESPVHEVALAPFFASKYEMTQAQWERFAGANPSSYGAGTRFAGRATTRLHPVENVGWMQASEVLARLTLALPTEAQWEYAARAGTQTPWWTGAEKESLQGSANFADQFSKQHGGPPNWAYEDWLDDGWVVHAPVGSFRANPFGLHDVAGNVWELCRDAHGTYSDPVAPGDGERRSAAASNSRTIRGGSYQSSAATARSSNRADVQPDYHDFGLGLRPARALDP